MSTKSCDPGTHSVAANLARAPGMRGPGRCPPGGAASPAPWVSQRGGRTACHPGVTGEWSGEAETPRWRPRRQPGPGAPGDDRELRLEKRREGSRALHLPPGTPLIWQGKVTVTSWVVSHFSSFRARGLSVPSFCEVFVTPSASGHGPRLLHPMTADQT